MVHTDRSALICDMAETYGIYDMGSLPVTTVAILASGLRDNSRIKMKLAGMKVSNELLLLAHAVDRLSVLIWQDTKDGMRGRNKPPSIAEKILYGDSNKKFKTDGFDTPDAFWETRRKILERGRQNG